MEREMGIRLSGHPKALFDHFDGEGNADRHQSTICEGVHVNWCEARFFLENRCLKAVVCCTALRTENFNRAQNANYG
jgi:hypothetical protein